MTYLCILKNKAMPEISRFYGIIIYKF